RRRRHTGACARSHRRGVRPAVAAPARFDDFRSGVFRVSFHSSYFRLRTSNLTGILTMKARVYVTLKPSVFDPQGSTIADALHSLGYSTVADVRQGKFFELDLDVASRQDAEQLASEIAGRVLANPVIESFRVELIDSGGRS